MTGGQPEDDAWGIPGVAMPQPPVGEPAGHLPSFGVFEDQEAEAEQVAEAAAGGSAAIGGTAASGMSAAGGSGAGAPGSGHAIAGAAVSGGVAPSGVGRVAEQPQVTRSEAAPHDSAGAGQAVTEPAPPTNPRTEVSAEALPPPAGEPIIAMLPTADETPTALMSAVRIDPADEAPTQLIPVISAAQAAAQPPVAPGAFGPAAAAQRPQPGPGGSASAAPPEAAPGRFAQPTASRGFVQPAPGGFAQPTHPQPTKPGAASSAPAPARATAQTGPHLPLAHSAEATQLVQVAFQVPATTPGGPRRPVQDPPTLREPIHPPRRRRTALISILAAVAVVGVATAVIVLNHSGSSQPKGSLGDQTGRSGQPAASGQAGAAGAVPGLAVSSSSGATPGASSGSSNASATSPKASHSGAAAATSPASAKSLASSLVLHWSLDDGSGTTAADSGPRDESGKLSGPVKFSSAHGGSAVFTPASGQIKGAAITTSQSLDTTKSFTVSMWVNQSTPTTPTKYVCPFTQDGPNYSAFFFTYSTAQQKWFFGRSLSATTQSGTDESWAYSTTPLNTWVLLTGVYDASAGTVTLYVNGAAQEPVHTRSAPYAVSGPLALGRSWYQTYPSNPFAGSISDFRVYDRVLLAAEVKSLLSAG